MAVAKRNKNKRFSLNVQGTLPDKGEFHSVVTVCVWVPSLGHTHRLIARVSANQITAMASMCACVSCADTVCPRVRVSVYFFVNVLYF